MRALASLVLLLLCYSPGWGGDTAYIDCTGLDVGTVYVSARPDMKAETVGSVPCGKRVIVNRGRDWATIQLPGTSWPSYVPNVLLSVVPPHSSCHLYLVLKRQLKSGRQVVNAEKPTRPQFKWWLREGRQRFRGLCFTVNPERASYILLTKSTVRLVDNFRTVKPEDAFRQSMWLGVIPAGKTKPIFTTYRVKKRRAPAPDVGVLIDALEFLSKQVSATPGRK